MLEPQDIEIGGKTYVLTKFPATAGREILLQYPTSAMPKIGDYATNESLMLRIMSYVGVRIDGKDAPLMLSTRALVDNHVLKTEDLLRLEWAMMSHNFDFFANGKLSGFLALLGNKAAASIQLILTALLQQSSAKDAQR